MNLIGHLACARTLPAQARLGAMLPDLLPIYDRRCKVPPLLRQWDATPGCGMELRRCAAGVRFHMQVDSRFHRLPLFVEGFRELRQTLAGASAAPGLKRLLTAHVLLELYLDHLLLCESPTLADDFYGLLRRQRGLIDAFCSARPGFERQRFRVFLERILEHGFLDEYLTMGGLLARMNRIQLKLAQRMLEPAEEQALQEYLEARRAPLRDALLAYVAEEIARAPAELWAPDTTGLAWAQAGAGGSA